MQKVFVLSVHWATGEVAERYFYSLKVALFTAGMLRSNSVVKYMTLKTGRRDTLEWVKEIAKVGLT